MPIEGVLLLRCVELCASPLVPVCLLVLVVWCEVAFLVVLRGDEGQNPSLIKKLYSTSNCSLSHHRHLFLRHRWWWSLHDETKWFFE